MDPESVYSAYITQLNANDAQQAASVASASAIASMKSAQFELAQTLSFAKVTQNASPTLQDPWASAGVTNSYFNAATRMTAAQAMSQPSQGTTETGSTTTSTHNNHKLALGLGVGLGLGGAAALLAAAYLLIRRSRTRSRREFDERTQHLAQRMSETNV